ncbi:MAG: TIGR02281 family clan AA aspartic protease [Rickettsiaceae bacterium H1]|nr:TIGR02281 family clan AA aspartic protease [Rickettsiaceae bacterium H1]
MITANAIYLSLLILMFLGMVWRWPSHRRKKAVFSLVGWIGITFVIVLLYSFRYELTNNKIVAGLIPGYGYTDAYETLRFKKALDGHFYVIATVNNTSIKFLLDTGASDTTLSLQDAKKLGLNVNYLAYTKRYNTANGMVEAAPVTIKSIKIGKNFVVENIPVSVNKGKMKHSLLGMSALSNFSINIFNDTLTIKH